MMMNRTHWITVGFLVVVIFAAFTAHVGAGDIEKQPALTTDKMEYKSGEIVEVSYNFLSEPQTDVTPRISIYQDPELILHVITWDAGAIQGKQKWNTSGLWDGTYYLVLKNHRQMGLLYEEEIISLSKFTLISGEKYQQPLLSIFNDMKRDFASGSIPIFTPNIYNAQRQEVAAWSILAS